MPNIIEKTLPSGIRNRLQTLIAAALGLFLGLRYNDYIRKIVSAYIPEGNLVTEGIVLIGLTVGIVYASVFLQRALDGR